MERRKFLIGAGSAAVGSSALIGSGAFNTVEANRTVSVEIEGDESAYLAMRPSDGENGAYAEQTGKTLEIQFDRLNDNAQTNFWDVFEIENTGVNDVFVWAQDVPEGLEIIATNPPSGNGTNLEADEPIDYEEHTASPPLNGVDDHRVNSGETMEEISLDVNTSDDGLTTGDYSITIYAERVDTFSNYENQSE